MVFSQRMTLHHWLYFMGRSRQEWSTFFQWSQNSVSLVGRTHSRSGSPPLPPMVTQAHSGAKPSTWSFSRCSRLSGMSMGMDTFSWPVLLNSPSSHAWMFSQMA